MEKGSLCKSNTGPVAFFVVDDHALRHVIKPLPNLRTHLVVAYVISALVHQLGTFILDRKIKNLARWAFHSIPVEPLPSDPGRQSRSETPISISCRVFPHLLSKYKLQTQASSHLPPNNFPTSAFSSPSP